MPGQAEVSMCAQIALCGTAGSTASLSYRTISSARRLRARAASAICAASCASIRWARSSSESLAFSHSTITEMSLVIASDALDRAVRMGPEPGHGRDAAGGEAQAEARLAQLRAGGLRAQGQEERCS